DAALGDGGIRALGLAGAAVDALAGDDRRHCSSNTIPPTRGSNRRVAVIGRAAEPQREEDTMKGLATAVAAGLIFAAGGVLAQEQPETIAVKAELETA